MTISFYFDFFLGGGVRDGGGGVQTIYKTPSLVSSLRRQLRALVILPQSLTYNPVGQKTLLLC